MTRDEILAQLSELSCSNHGCEIATRQGMGTNGACHCFSGLTPNERVRLRESVHMLRLLADDPALRFAPRRPPAELRAELETRACCAACVLWKWPGGVSTNGPCSCFAGLGWRERRRAEQAMQLYRLLADETA